MNFYFIYILQIIPMSNSDIRYLSNTDIQGECLLNEIHPVKRSKPLFGIFIFFSIIFVGLPALLVYWYPKLKRKFYFSHSTVEEATNFYIINYDVEATYPLKEQSQFHHNQATVDDQKKDIIIFFVNRFLKYLVREGQDGSWEIVPAFYDATLKLEKFQKTPASNISKLGLKESEVEQMQKSFGPGAMILPEQPVWLLFVKQIMRPLYLFIVFSTTLWFYQLYIYYAAIIVFTAAIGIVVNLIQTYKLNKKIHNMAYYETDVNVLREGKVEQMSSKSVVPGDIVFLKQPIKIPFDGVLLEGSLLVNECALTGESVPVVKKYVESTNIDKNCSVYEGTLLIQVNAKKKIRQFEQYRQKWGIPVCVLRTNFTTLKGQLIRIISFPKEKQNIFEKQSSKFLIFLFCLSCISYGILIAKLRSIVQPVDLALKFLDLITITVPPGLPVSMTFGIIFALEKLKDKQIFCISPNKVVAGGMVDFVCFDKTGTLTEDYMDFWGYIGCWNSKFNQQPLINDIVNGDEDVVRDQNKRNAMLDKLVKEKPEMIYSLNNMAVNHTIVQLQDTKEFIGDPMEVKLFEYGQFELKESASSDSDILGNFSTKRGHQGVILKRYEFDSQLFRMSTIATDSRTNDGAYIYTKGSPEQMLKMNVFNPKSVPSSYQQILRKYASMGFRVLAVAHRKIAQTQINKNMLSNSAKILEVLSKYNRLDLQKDLIFDGFQIFENRLKPATKSAIKQIRKADIPCVMITGDNPLTASNIGYKCKISNRSKKTFILDYENSRYLLQNFNYDVRDMKMVKSEAGEEQDLDSLDEENTQNLQGEQIKNVSHHNNMNIQAVQLGLYPSSSKQMRQTLLNPLTIMSETDISKILQKVDSQNGQLCMTGSAFFKIFIDESSLNHTSVYHKQILMKTRIYARAKPNDKASIINKYQQVLGKTAAMCGDGANDCGALKQANIGLSLSQTEASVAAPFTSQVTDISSMVELLKQCRAGLATNFSLFNIMALYSLIQYSTVVICQFYFSYPADFQFLYWDIFCNFLFFLTFGYTKTAESLSKDKPNSSLFTVSNIFQVVMMFGLQLTGQILMLVGMSQIFNQQIDYFNIGSESTNREKYNAEGDFLLDTPQTNILFLFTNLMYIFTLMAFSISRPWRKQFYTNIPFMIILVSVLSYSIVIIVVPKARLFLFELSYLDYEPLNLYVMGLAIGMSLIIYVNQKFILEPLFRSIKNKYPSKQWI